MATVSNDPKRLCTGSKMVLFYGLVFNKDLLGILGPLVKFCPVFLLSARDEPQTSNMKQIFLLLGIDISDLTSSDSEFRSSQERKIPG